MIKYLPALLCSTIVVFLLLQTTTLRRCMKVTYTPTTQLLRSKQFLIPTTTTSSSSLMPNNIPLYISPNEILDRTVFVIKTYNRLQCLMTLLHSLVKNAKYIQVIIADDSSNDQSDDIKEVGRGFDLEPIYIRLPIDSGVGYGRNRLVKKAHELGYKYLIMADDDFVIPNQHLIPRMAQTFIDLRADVLSPLRCEVNVNERHISGKEYWDGKWDNTKCGRGEVAAFVSSPTTNGKSELIVLPNVTRPYIDDEYTVHPILPSSRPKFNSIGHRYDCHRSDLVQQFFLGNVEKLLNSGWDDHLKNNDHYDAMLSFKKRNMRLFICRRLKISHNSLGCTRHDTGVAYLNVRKKRWMNLMPYVLQKWNLTALYDEVGRKWSINSNNIIQTQCGVECNRFPPFPFLKKISNKDITKKEELKYNYALKTLEWNVNSNRPSWDTLSFFTKKYTNQEIKMKDISPCMSKIVGQIILPKWSIRSAKSSTDILLPTKISFGSLNIKNCNALNQILRKIELNKYKSSTIQVYYVMVISSFDDIHLDTVLKNLEINGHYYNKNKIIKVNLLLIIMNGKIKDKKEDYIISYLKNKVNIYVLRTSPPFGRSIGLKMGYQYIRTTLESNNNNNDNKHDIIVFSLDASIKLPNDFTKLIIKSVSCGKVAFAPVCKKNNKWVEGGYGMVGMCLSDYFQLSNGWREKWWYKWGAEDVDIITQIQKKLLIHRPKVENYLHLGSKKSRKHNGNYYKGKNLYPSYLPVVPITDVMNNNGEDSNMIKKIKTFIINNNNKYNYEFDTIVWRTQMRPEDATIIYSLWETKNDELIIVSMARPEAPQYNQPEWRKKPDSELLLY
jgi:hypothetical protein